ncbi:WAP four-disulfide core domain protein 2-like [Puntigrus tetrazona]|uniref:WAP four-disulfide core domain protein 2-like n=1 Tax=Puntigrus tetrazona TaxID=1606681 RepID=UPI001C890B5B|nr:WAP four-disulfide core domain protein 2-like [Puntigrus tetrazona]
MTVQVYCLLTAVLCLSVYLSTTDAAQSQTVKPGACPPENLVGGLCTKTCAVDAKCPGTDKCCSNGCGRHCMPPYIVKPGRCPKPEKVSPSVQGCTYDGQCASTLKCCPASSAQACAEPHGHGKGRDKKMTELFQRPDCFCGDKINGSVQLWLWLICV